MDTQIAVDTLKALISTLESEILGKTAQRDALVIGLQQLEGTLQTQLTELEVLKSASIVKIV